jgi:hypothetical protein
MEKVCSQCPKEMKTMAVKKAIHPPLGLVKNLPTEAPKMRKRKRTKVAMMRVPKVEWVSTKSRDRRRLLSSRWLKPRKSVKKIERGTRRLRCL